MPEGVGIPTPPVLEYATLEQALRWVAYSLPPLQDKFEHLEGYPAVVKKAAAEFGGNVGDLPPGYGACGKPLETYEVLEAWRQLARSMALGALPLFGSLWESRKLQDEGGEYQLDEDGFVRTKWERKDKRSIVPADDIDPRFISWDKFFGATLTHHAYDGPDRHYIFLSVRFADLLCLFPPPDAHSTYQAPRPAQGPLYTTSMLRHLDTLRAEITAAGDWERRPVTRAWVAERMKSEGLSGRDINALARMLIPDERRGKATTG